MPKNQNQNYGHIRNMEMRQRCILYLTHIDLWLLVYIHVLLTFNSNLSMLVSQACLRWSSGISSTSPYRSKCSRASFSCISLTCSIWSIEHSLPESKGKDNRMTVTRYLEYLCDIPYIQYCNNAICRSRGKSLQVTHSTSDYLNKKFLGCKDVFFFFFFFSRNPMCIVDANNWMLLVCIKQLERVCIA